MRPVKMAVSPLIFCTVVIGIASMKSMKSVGKAGVLEAQPPLVEATFTSTTCRYVEMGFGIGLIFVPRGRQVHPGFHVRVMSRDFGRTVIYQVHRKGVPPFQSVIAFLDIGKDRLRHPPAGPHGKASKAK